MAHPKRNRRSKKNALKRVAIYGRRSKDDGDDTISIPEQIADCRKYAKEKGWGEVVEVRRENRSGVSGFNRPVFVELIEAAEAGEFDVFLTLDMSRFGRFDADERGYWVTRLKAAGVETRHVLDDDRLAGEAGPIMGAVLQTGQREHSLKTAYKVAAGQIAALKRGCWPGGSPPYGYRTERRPGFDGTGRRDAKVLIDEKEAEVVRRIFEIRNELQLGYASIARRLNAEDKRRRSGGRWTGVAIKRILDNEAYIGNFVRGRSRGGKTAKFFVVTESGPVKVEEGGPQAGRFTVEGFYPELVTREVWDIAQAIRVDRKKQYGNQRERASYRQYLLTEFTVCGACGESMVVGEGTQSARNHRYSYAVCSRKKKGSEVSEGCQRARVQVAALEKRVLEVVRQIAAKIDPAQVAERLRSRLEGKPARAKVDVKALETRRAHLRNRRRKLLLSDCEFVQDGLQELADEDARLGRRIQSAKRRQKGPPADLEDRIKRAVEQACKVQTPNTNEETEAARVLLRTFVKEIEVAPGERYRPKLVKLTVYTPEGLGELFIDEASPRVDEMLEELFWGLERPGSVGHRLPEPTLATELLVEHPTQHRVELLHEPREPTAGVRQDQVEVVPHEHEAVELNPVLTCVGPEEKADQAIDATRGAEEEATLRTPAHDSDGAALEDTTRMGHGSPWKLRTS